MPKKHTKKEKIPKALREQVWVSRMGKVYEGKCPIVWCSNTINVYDFQCGHNIPESRGGKTDLTNLIPLCSRCNMSMSNIYTIDEWNRKSKLPVVQEVQCCSCFMQDRLRQVLSRAFANAGLQYFCRNSCIRRYTGTSVPCSRNRYSLQSGHC